MAKDDKEIILFQIHRGITVLCKHFLNLVEDLQEEYDRYLVEDGNTHGELADRFLDDKHFGYLRKKILDKGGEINRELHNEISKYKLEMQRNEKEEGNFR